MAAAQRTRFRSVAVDGMHDLHRVATVRADVIVDRQRDLPEDPLPARHPHAALGAVERPLVTGAESAVSAHDTAGALGRPRPINHNGPDRMVVARDVVEEACENAGGVAIRVTTDALATPTHDGADDHVAGDLVPVRYHPAYDGVVVGETSCVDLTVEQAHDHGFEDGVDRVDQIQDDESVPCYRRSAVVVLEPLSAAGQASDERSGPTELHGQRLNEFRLTLHIAEEHAPKPVADRGSTLEANRFGTLGRVRELERELAGVHLLDERLLGCLI